MNRQDAAQLGQDIAKTWRGGPHADVWAEELEPLHTNQAREAYRRLRQSEEHSPSVAKFLAVYRSLTTHDDDRVVCERCDGGGWVEVVEHSRFCDTQPGCHCSAVKPCHCQAGRRVETAFTRIAGTKPNAA